MKKPIIGITLDSREPGGYSNYPWYALRRNYCDVIEKAGAIPLPLPHVLEAVDTFSGLMDGLVISGGGFDIDPSLYGVMHQHETVTLNPSRTQFEWAMLEAIFSQRKPILGICGGMQLVNVVFGGTLIQHIPDEVETSLVHKQEGERHKPSHTVHVQEGTLLQKILGQKEHEFPVNSVHHQAVKVVSPKMRVNAIAPDGIIEGIEHTDYPFCLGIQWHPEFIVSPQDQAIFNAFIQEAQNACQNV